MANFRGESIRHGNGGVLAEVLRLRSESLRGLRGPDGKTGFRDDYANGVRAVHVTSLRVNSRATSSAHAGCDRMIFVAMWSTGIFAIS